jgi:hypothetical protein
MRTMMREEKQHEQKHHDQSQQRFPHPAPPKEVLAVLLEDTIGVDLVVILQYDHVAVARASLARESQEREESPKRWRYAVRRWVPMTDISSPRAGRTMASAPGGKIRRVLPR